MFKTLLVANRGEIARRVFRTCRALGIRTVAVYSEVDRNSAHVADADEAICIGPAKATESYLVVENILEAAKQAGAEAIHPGYGFLAENADFARAVTDAGITWVGPDPESIIAMGDKQRARDIAQAAGVPVVPGSGRFEPTDIHRVEDAGAAVGYPLLVKAAAGGGGIGMRRVDDGGALRSAVTSTQSMAERAFGDGTVFLERFIPKARHVEVQVFGFGDGRAVHAFERDCSLQRRFQKIVEEAPAPGIREDVRAAMASAALGLCKVTRYAGAGTVEFIVDAVSQEFYFLEMNTRIQVEHPVTEMITGLDLVELQLRLAAGEIPDLTQEALGVEGHAIECRLYAENPAKMFMPSPGTLETLHFPALDPPIGPDYRVETGYRTGDAITPYYDPMIAKLVVRGADREEARQRMLVTLRATRVEGIKSNLEFLIACLSHPGFASGDVHTGFVDANKPELTGKAPKAT